MVSPGPRMAFKFSMKMSGVHSWMRLNMRSERKNVHLLSIGGGEGEVAALGVHPVQQLLLRPQPLVVPGESISLFRKYFFYQNRLTDMSTVRSWVTSLKFTRFRMFTEA